MGTEQQQELKSEKPPTKQQRKTIPCRNSKTHINMCHYFKRSIYNHPFSTQHFSWLVVR